MDEGKDSVSSKSGTTQCQNDRTSEFQIDHISKVQCNVKNKGNDIDHKEENILAKMARFVHPCFWYYWLETILIRRWRRCGRAISTVVRNTALRGCAGRCCCLFRFLSISPRCSCWCTSPSGKASATFPSGARRSISTGRYTASARCLSSRPRRRRAGSWRCSGSRSDWRVTWSNGSPPNARGSLLTSRVKSRARSFGSCSTSFCFFFSLHLETCLFCSSGTLGFSCFPCSSQLFLFDSNELLCSSFGSRLLFFLSGLFCKSFW